MQCLQSGDQAIKDSLLVLTKSILTTRNTFIYTDSQAALESLKSLMISWKMVKYCLDLLVDLTSYVTIILQWVSVHSDILGESDELAKADTILQFVLLAESWWRQSLNCSTSLPMWHKWNMDRTCTLLKFKRNDIRTLVRVLKGRCLIGRHGSRLGKPILTIVKAVRKTE